MMKQAFLIGPALAACLLAGSCVSNDVGGNIRNADGNEVWSCNDRFSSVDTIVLTRHLQDGRDVGTGAVQTAGVTRSARFHIDGIERRWDWGSGGGSEGTGYLYSFTIDASGEGKFYKFGSEDRVKPSGFYECHTGSILEQLLK